MTVLLKAVFVVFFFICVRKSKVHVNRLSKCLPEHSVLYVFCFLLSFLFALVGRDGIYAFGLPFECGVFICIAIMRSQGHNYMSENVIQRR